jgi:hypothetical protein
MSGALQYEGIKIFLAEKLGRQLAVEEKAIFPSYLEIDEKHFSEAKELCLESAVLAIAYMRYVVTSDIAEHANTYVYRVLVSGKDVRELIRVGVLPG